MPDGPFINKVNFEESNRFDPLSEYFDCKPFPRRKNKFIHENIILLF